jgi:predicted CXXCH cytochrome family protein
VEKKSVFQGAGGESTDHLVVVNGLDLNRAYRFRIILTTAHNADDAEKLASQWLGLLPAEIDEDMPMDLPAGNTGLTWADGVTLQSLGLARTGGFIVVTWQTDSLSSGWLEVEALEEMGLAEMLPDERSEIQSATTVFSEKDHTDMRDPEDIAIDICYSCHLTGAMNSHPVRLRTTSSSTRIPDDLPTVDGLLTCVTCHHPHSSDGKALTRKRVVTKLCIACHFQFNRYSLDDIGSE